MKNKMFSASIVAAVAGIVCLTSGCYTNSRITSDSNSWHDANGDHVRAVERSHDFSTDPHEILHHLFGGYTSDESYNFVRQSGTTCQQQVVVVPAPQVVQQQPQVTYMSTAPAPAVIVQQSTAAPVMIDGGTYTETPIQQPQQQTVYVQAPYVQTQIPSATYYPQQSSYYSQQPYYQGFNSGLRLNFQFGGGGGNGRNWGGNYGGGCNQQFPTFYRPGPVARGFYGGGWNGGGHGGGWHH